MFINIIGFGLFDHLAQILNTNVDRLKRGPVQIRRRQFTKESTDEFNYLLQKNHGSRVFQISVLMYLWMRSFIIII
jgi:hypothetical protein